MHGFPRTGMCAAGSRRSASDAWTTSDGKASRGHRIGRCWWLHCCTHGKMSGGKVSMGSRRLALVLRPDGARLVSVLTTVLCEEVLLIYSDL